MKVLITGASGLVGSALATDLMQRGIHDVRGAVRANSKAQLPEERRALVGDLGADTDWRAALSGIDAVVHLAARVHVMRETERDALSVFRRVNVAGTLKLAEQAAAAGVRRFVFMSTVKVNKEEGMCVESDRPAPTDPYSISKLEAEDGLRFVSSKSGMELVVIRPPLVYGPGVRANFLSLMRAIARGVPLPFGAVSNKRSYIGVDNLTDFIIRCLEHPNARGETFLLCDGEDLSTAELVQQLARSMGRRPRLFPVPEWLMVAGAAILGRKDMAQRLLSSLQIDSSKARRMLAWHPRLSVDEGMRLTVNEFLGRVSRERMPR